MILKYSVVALHAPMDTNQLFHTNGLAAVMAVIAKPIAMFHLLWKVTVQHNSSKDSVLIS
jgi:hypothetical protein